MNQFTIFWRLERKPLIGWALGLGAFIVLMGLVFTTSASDFEQLWEDYPDTIKEFIPEGDLSSIGGFLQLEAGSFFPIMFAIFLVMLMSKHLSGAEESGRLDHALARPVTRAAYYWNLHLAVLAIFATLLAAIALAGILGFSGDATGRDVLGIIGFSFEFLPLGIAFIGIGGLTGALFHRRSQSNGVGVAVAVLFFALSIVGRVATDFDWVSNLTPMGLLDRSDLFEGQLDAVYTIACLTLGAVTSVAGWWVFENKNLYA